MSFFRLSAALGALLAAAFAFSRAGAAQDIKDISIATEWNSAGGYMALGGGLGKAILDEHPIENLEVAKAEAENPDSEKPTTEKSVKKSASVAHRRQQPRASPSDLRRKAYSVTPMALVVRTLDHYGL